MSEETMIDAGGFGGITADEGHRDDKSWIDGGFGFRDRPWGNEGNITDGINSH